MVGEDRCMTEDEARTTYDRFLARDLPKAMWTHEAHLAVCWLALSRCGPVVALDVLREAIRSYNVATGGANTSTSGYHETLTRYFVEEVGRFSSLNDVLGAASCARQAPLGLWSSELLFSSKARQEWVAPDLHAAASVAAGSVYSGSVEAGSVEARSV